MNKENMCFVDSEKMCHKRGDTLAFIINVEDENEEPLDLDVSDIKSQMRNSSGVLIEDFTVSKTGTIGEYLLESTGDESDYPLGTMKCDVEFNIDGKIKSSSTFSIIIVEDITRDE